MGIHRRKTGRGGIIVAIRAPIWLSVIILEMPSILWVGTSIARIGSLESQNRTRTAITWAYHEGVGGFQRGTFKSKRWLISVAKRVDQYAKTYDSQLSGCRDQLDSGSWWNPFN